MLSYGAYCGDNAQEYLADDCSDFGLVEVGGEGGSSDAGGDRNSKGDQHRTCLSLEHRMAQNGVPATCPRGSGISASAEEG